MAHRLRRMVALIALIGILSVLIAACGGGGGNQANTGAEQNATSAAPTTAADAGTGTGTGTEATADAGTGAGTEVTADAGTGTGTEVTVTADAGTGAGTEETATADAGAGTGTEETATADAGTGTGTEETATADAGAGMGTEETATAGAGTEETATAGAGTGADTGTTATAGAGGGDTGTAGGTAMTLPADCTNVELQYWNPFTGPDGPFMGQMTDAFNEANPNIRVTMTTQSEYGTQLETAAAAQQLPDVAIMWADQVPRWAARGVFRPMDDLVTQMGVSGGDFPEAIWSAGEYNGQRYSVPLDIHPLVMFYNADLLQGAGINNPPTNREEFEAAAQSLTNEQNKGFMITAGFPHLMIFRSLLYQFGGSDFNEEGTEVTFNSEAGVQALQWMKDAQANYSEPNLEVDAELNAFKGGNVGMIWNGIWQTSNVTGEGVEFNGQAAPFPNIGGQAAVAGGSHQFTLPVQQNEDPCKTAAAGIFIRYMLDNSITWASAGQIPALNSVRESLGQGGGAAEGGEGAQGIPLETIAALAPSADFMRLPPKVAGITDAFPPIEEAVGAIMSGNATDIKAALDEAATRANQILEENRATFGASQ